MIEIIKRFNEKSSKIKLKNGDVVYMKGTKSTMDFIGIYIYGYGIIELENGSDVYCCNNGNSAITGEQVCETYIGDKLSYWIIDRKLKATITVEEF